MSALETYPSPTRELELPSSKRLVLVTGRANPALAGKIASKLGIELGGMTLKTFTNGEVYCRFRSRCAAATCSSSSRPAAMCRPG